MQLVQPSKFFSVTIFRTRYIGSIGMRACELGYVAIFNNSKNFDVCTVVKSLSLFSVCDSLH